MHTTTPTSTNPSEYTNANYNINPNVYTNIITHTNPSKYTTDHTPYPCITHTATADEAEPPIWQSKPSSTNAEKLARQQQASNRVCGHPTNIDTQHNNTQNQTQDTTHSTLTHNTTTRKTEPTTQPTRREHANYNPFKNSNPERLKQFAAEKCLPQGRNSELQIPWHLIGYICRRTPSHVF